MTDFLRRSVATMAPSEKIGAGFGPHPRSPIFCAPQKFSRPPKKRGGCTNPPSFDFSAITWRGGRRPAGGGWRDFGFTVSSAFFLNNMCSFFTTLACVFFTICAPFSQNVCPFFERGHIFCTDFIAFPIEMRPKNVPPFSSFCAPFAPFLCSFYVTFGAEKKIPTARALLYWCAPGLLWIWVHRFFSVLVLEQYCPPAK